MKARALVCLLALMALGMGCRTKCEDLVAESLPGSYRGGGSLGDERLLNVAVDADAKQVALTFTTKDGARVRALYRVDKKVKRKVEAELLP